jgi:hypothetical protein
VVERSLPQREGLAAFVELRELIRILFSETEECVFGLPSGSFTARLVLIVLICISAVAGASEMCGVVSTGWCARQYMTLADAFGI